MKEIWKEIPNFPAFIINQYGKVIRIKKRGKDVFKEVKPDLSGKYAKVSLCVNNQYYRFSVHVLVCTIFNGPKPSPLHEVNHNDGIKRNNFNENLEWLTHAENIQHSFNKLGRQGPNLGRKFSPEWK